MERNISINDEIIENIGILCKLSPGEEKERIKRDMEEMIDFVNKLSELDTDNVQPMSHVYDINNVFREDEVTCGDMRSEMMANAPEKEEEYFKVPKSI